MKRHSAVRGSAIAFCYCGVAAATVCSRSRVMEEYCVVCAEPIQFTAYGPCGHKDACSKCIVRLRVVLEDKRCVICQQMHDSVFVTKNLGDFTPTLPATAFPELQVLALFTVLV